MRIDTDKTSAVVGIAQQYNIASAEIKLLSQLRNTEYYSTQRGKELEKYIYDGIIMLSNISTTYGCAINKEKFKKLVTQWVKLTDAKYDNKIGKITTDVNTLLEAITMEYNKAQQNYNSYSNKASQLTAETISGFADIVKGGHAFSTIINDALAKLEKAQQQLSQVVDGSSGKSAKLCQQYCKALLEWSNNLCNGIPVGGDEVVRCAQQWTKLPPVSRITKKDSQAIEAFTVNTGGAFNRDLELSTLRYVADTFFNNLKDANSIAKKRLAEVERERPQFDYNVEAKTLTAKYKNGEITQSEAIRQTQALNRRKQSYEFELSRYEQRRRFAESRVTVCGFCDTIRLTYQDMRHVPEQLYSLCTAVDFVSLQEYLNGADGDPVSIINMLTDYITAQSNMTTIKQKELYDHVKEQNANFTGAQTVDNGLQELEALMAMTEAQDVQTEQQPVVVDEVSIRSELGDL